MKDIIFCKGDRVMRKRDGKILTVLSTHICELGDYPQDIRVKEKFLFSTPEGAKNKYIKMWHSADWYELHCRKVT